jgi:peptide/nickel transport system substrate-binding protein
MNVRQVSSVEDFSRIQEYIDDQKPMGQYYIDTCASLIVVVMNTKLVLAVALIVVVALAGSYAFLMPKPPTYPVETTTTLVETSTTPKIPKGGTLTIGVLNEPDTLNLFESIYTYLPDNLIYGTLVTCDTNGAYHDGLAESWEVSPDGLLWTFHLKHGVTFHDRTPFNAQAVKWQIDIARTAPCCDYMFYALNRTVVVDDYTVQLVLNYPDANLQFNLATEYLGMMSPTAYEKYGADYGSKYAVGTGPFVLEEWVRGDHFNLVRNENYAWAPSWYRNRGAPYLDKIAIRLIPETTTALLQFEAGVVDVLIGVPPFKVAGYGEDPNIEVLTRPAPRVIPIWFNQQKAPFDDARVRQAIAFAIDRRSIVENIFYGLAEEAHNLLPPAIVEHDIPHEYDLGFDTARAKALLADAGWTPGADGILENRGRRFATTLTTSDEGVLPKLAEVLQAQLRDIGIDVKIIVFDRTTFNAKLEQGDVEMFLRLWDWYNADILDWFFVSTRIPFPNYSRFNDTTFDRMDEEALASPTWETRVNRFKEIHIYLMEKAVWAPIVYTYQIVGSHKNVRGLEVHPWSDSYIPYSDVYLT